AGAWERCEIVFEEMPAWFGCRGLFRAEWSDGRTAYDLERTAVFDCGLGRKLPQPSDPRAQALHRELVARLLADGWEPEERRAGPWWQGRYRRRLSADREECDILLGPYEQQGRLLLTSFVAFVRGPRGCYAAASVELVLGEGQRLEADEGRTSAAVLKAHQDLLVRLLSEGWQTTGKVGRRWWNLRLERALGHDGGVGDADQRG
ncbi:MAG: hypothetical protein ACUVX9_11365, partial [Anaerolineae bacterium]